MVVNKGTRKVVVGRGHPLLGRGHRTVSESGGLTVGCWGLALPGVFSGLSSLPLDWKEGQCPVACWPELQKRPCVPLSSPAPCEVLVSSSHPLCSSDRVLSSLCHPHLKPLIFSSFQVRFFIYGSQRVHRQCPVLWEGPRAFTRSRVSVGLSGHMAMWTWCVF